ncbi:MAG: DUF2380 domain-containing protein [Caldilineaceae bacterium SB0661_bin_32]|uniref:DUF2380 domain-containing protein n=1 Tax=Caldilineaceae bacterium SB0661_bin_32 TaxID=2605255 RepID=A0A6B1D681_9CHLR|nr:DUF2380 domain-containing protein [Caldilineaceae bacterium SB0665_bin_25]MYC95421.1 DUF2380 domain-containing protein [Caldilineaceae bacterium SB0661_bin_32]
MKRSSILGKRKLAIVLAVFIVMSLIFNSGIVVAASKYDDGEEPEECPASLVRLGEDLWAHVPELPSLDWDFSLADKANLLWRSFLLLLDSILPGISRVFPKLPDFEWLLAWLPANWFESDSLTTVPVISQASGVVLGLVPVVGPMLDGTAIVTAKDQITGECISRMGQGVLLASAGATMVFPALLAVKGGLKVGKPLAKVLPDIPLASASSDLLRVVEDFRGRIGWKVPRLTKVNSVAKAYRGMRRVVGNGATSPGELAEKMGLQGFTDSNYREGLLRLTGRTSEEVQGLEAHHLFPQKFEQKFRSAGVETIHDPRLLVWVDEVEHKSWSNAYNEAWQTFFNEHPNATVEEILEEGKMLADEFGYQVLYQTPGNRLTEWFRLLLR